MRRPCTVACAEDRSVDAVGGQRQAVGRPEQIEIADKERPAAVGIEPAHHRQRQRRQQHDCQYQHRQQPAEAAAVVRRGSFSGRGGFVGHQKAWPIET